MIIAVLIITVNFDADAKSETKGSKECKKEVIPKGLEHPKVDVESYLKEGETENERHMKCLTSMTLPSNIPRYHNCQKDSENQDK